MPKIHYWTLDETTGNRLDAIGTAHGVPSNVTYSPALFSNGALAATANGYLDCGNPADMQFTTEPFTISAFISIKSAVASTKVFIAKYNWTGSQRSWALSLQASYTLRFAASADGTALSNLDYTLPGPGLYHVAIRRLGTTYDMFVQGANVASMTGPASLLNSTSNLTILSFYPGAVGYGFLEGWIDNIEVWDEARTDYQIKQILYPTVVNISVNNFTPVDGSTDQLIDTTIDFDVISEGDYPVNFNTFNTVVDGSNAIVNGIAQTGWSFISTAITSGYNIVLSKDTSFDYSDTITTQIMISDSAPIANVMTPFLSSFITEDDVVIPDPDPEPVPDHIIKYNIYYKSALRSNWKLSNPEPLNHNLEGNSYTISGLQSGAIYHVAVIAGTMINGTWEPLISQSIIKEQRGIGDLNTVKNHPYFVIKTFV